MLGPGSRKRQCYRETSGLRCGRERECGHGRRGAGPIWRPLMRVYIINADDLIVSREAPAHLSENEIVVASLDELRAARLSGKRLLTLWNGLPGVERLSKVGDREALIERLWSALEALPDRQPVRASKQAEVIALLRRPEGATVDEVRAITGWQPHTVRGMFSGALKKKLGLGVIPTKEERGRVYRVSVRDPGGNSAISARLAVLGGVYR